MLVFCVFFGLDHAFFCLFSLAFSVPIFSPVGKLGEAESVCAHALSIVEHNKETGAETPHLMAALLKLQSKILKRQGTPRFCQGANPWDT